MAADPGVIVAYGAASAPSGWLLCDGATPAQATYPALYAAIGNTFGSDAGGNFTLPDLRGRFALGKSVSGTGSVLGGTGGLIDHTHTGPSHTHGVNQPGDHTAHSVTQPASHGTLTHSGAAVSAHSTLTHTGAALSDHSIGSEAGTHAQHTANATHTHDAHTLPTDAGASSRTYINGPGTHAANATHQHDAHPAHTGSTVDAHSVTQAADHTADTHTVSAQPTSHGTLTHSGATVTLAHSHAGMATTADGTGATGTGNPPFQAVTFIIATGTADIPVAAITDHGGSAAPADHYLCDGSAYDTTSDATLFGIIGYTFGGAGASFNVPDLRDRHPLGKAASGTGSTLGGTGGGKDHVHSGPSHTHPVTQANAHGSHTIGQPTSHGALTHTGTTVSDHAALSHASLSVAAHSIGQPNAHGAHASQGGHQHNSHTTLSTNAAGSGTRYLGPTTHSTDGAHTHTDTHTHTGQAVSAHSVSAQPSQHAAQSHSVTQPDSHGTLDHSGAALDAHSAHSGGATTADGTGNTGTGNAPYLVTNFVIRKAAGSHPVGSGYAVGLDDPPAGTVFQDGQEYDRVGTYAALFAVIGTAFGSVDADHFNVPDARGRIHRGKSASTALGDTGGGFAHTHTGPSHTHGTTQPSAHSDHTPTQPTSHGTLDHTGFALADHAALSHSGLTLSDHTYTQASGHGTHTSEGAHTHDVHTGDALASTSGSTQARMSAPVTHASQGGHTHDAHAAHSGFALTSAVHSVTSSGSDHALRSHAALYTQPASHGTLTHSAFAVDAHSAHSGFSTIADGTGATGTADPPFQAVNYVIQYEATAPPPVTGSIAGTGAAPSGSLTGKERILGSASGTGRAATAALFGKERFLGTVAGTGAASTASVAGKERFLGAIAATSTAASAVLSGRERLAGSLAGIQAAPSGAIAAKERMVGPLVSMQDAASAALAGSVAEPIAGTIAGHQAPASGALAGAIVEPVTGILAGAQAPQAGHLWGLIAVPVMGAIAGTQARQRASLRGIGGESEPIAPPSVVQFLRPLPPRPPFVTGAIAAGQRPPSAHLVGSVNDDELAVTAILAA